MLDIEQKKREPVRIFCDSQGCGWNRIYRPNELPAPTKPFDESQYLALQEVVRRQEPADFLRIITPISFSEVQRTIPLLSDHPLTDKIRGLVGACRSAADFVLPYLPTSENREAFWPYWPSRDARLGFARLVDKYQAKISICTGMPDPYAQNFGRKVNTSGFRPFLDKKYPIFMTPGQFPDSLWPGGKGSSYTTKLGVAYYFYLVDGRFPISIDDNIEINELMANLLGMISFNPFTQEEAERRRKHSFPKELEKYRVGGGRIIHARISRIPEILATLQLPEMTKVA